MEAGRVGGGEDKGRAEAKPPAPPVGRRSGSSVGEDKEQSLTRDGFLMEAATKGSGPLFLFFSNRFSLPQKQERAFLPNPN
jgi:hypothetical protein